MEILFAIPTVILVIGLSAVSLARRPPVPCTACRTGRLAIQRDFVWRCGTSKAQFQMRDGKLEQAPPVHVELPRAVALPRRDPG